MVNLINQERASNGLSALQVDTQLTQLARMKSQDMITNNYFSHTSPTYGTPSQMLSTYGVTYRTMGENIAGNSSVQAAHTSLMNSSGHRANILSSSYTHVGVGVVSGGPYGEMITQIFVGR
ncbi:transporter [Desulfocucumis palustris]|uniref:Transporter n=2 Tax=Desulfocucumis palustris TaxID=1898651 RepID=A0A2L2XGW7_9FIRM|nr:transporter [Desulfocucumis palustris]